MTSTHRFVITTNDVLQNFLIIQETDALDLIISTRGRRHSAQIGSEAAKATHVDDNAMKVFNITVHPNLDSKYESVSINYKVNAGKGKDRKVATVSNIRFGQKIFPVITSIGRNVASPKLSIDRNEYINDNLIELWPGNSIDLAHDSLAYSVWVANPKIKFVFPEDFTIDTVPLAFQYFQVLFVYWRINHPTKLRGTTVTFDTRTPKYMDGFEFHEALNFTINSTRNHLQVCSSLPQLPQVNLPVNTDAPTNE
jgi:hypothetical protein